MLSLVLYTSNKYIKLNELYKISGGDDLKKKLISKMTTKVLGLVAFIATGGGLIISTVINEENFYKIEILIIFGCFFAISLVDHFKQTIEGNDKDED
ncbi:hypothetical protein [Miniphocaeibacter massiliensis]|uniref:hypothetical protein n=1 Tax=Miniphocaeibacter massiliensis TaxID=2041841 RepID=UPI000C1BEB1A|nr:hypothetical protein [Miniphocaeibacter massiliensis]